jgi:hypothetical protein
MPDSLDSPLEPLPIVATTHDEIAVTVDEAANFDSAVMRRLLERWGSARSFQSQYPGYWAANYAEQEQRVMAHPPTQVVSTTTPSATWVRDRWIGLDLETNPLNSWSARTGRVTSRQPNFTSREREETMFDIVVTNSGNRDSDSISNSSPGHIMLATSGEFNGHILLNIGANYFINLSKLDGLRYRVSDHNYMVRRLAPTEAITLIVTR